MNIKIEHWFDIGCSVCGRHRSTDFEKGLESSIKCIREFSKKEGWGADRAGNPICPYCISKKG